MMFCFFLFVFVLLLRVFLLWPLVTVYIGFCVSLAYINHFPLMASLVLVFLIYFSKVILFIYNVGYFCSSLQNTLELVLKIFVDVELYF